MKKNVFRITTHVFCITLFLLVQIWVSPRPSGIPLFEMTGPLKRDILASVLMIVFFYANYYFFLTRYYLQRKYLQYTLIIGASLVLVALLPSILTNHMPWNQVPMAGVNSELLPRKPKDSFLITVLHDVLLFVSVILISTAVGIKNRVLKPVKEGEMKSGSLSKRLSLIYNQSSVDFLESTDFSNYCIQLLSEMARKRSRRLVSLTSELSVLDKFIEVLVDKHGVYARIDYKKPESVPVDLCIAPLLVVALLDNLLKSKVYRTELAIIEIDLNGQQLSLRIFTKFISALSKSKPHMKPGLETIMDSLVLFYPKRHKSEMKRDDNGLEFILKLELDSVKEQNR